MFDKTFAHTHINACYHCQSCGNGCPFVGAMDYPPFTLIRFIRLGLMAEVLRSTAIWICVGCNKCCSVCPMAIDIPAMMDVLRQRALIEKVPIAEKGILQFHREVLNSIKRYGRTHKLEIMMRYKVKQKDFFSDLDVGLKMFAKRKLDLKPSKIKDLRSIQQLFHPNGNAYDGH